MRWVTRPRGCHVKLTAVSAAWIGTRLASVRISADPAAGLFCQARRTAAQRHTHGAGPGPVQGGGASGVCP
jgi:hypothetical protein